MAVHDEAINVSRNFCIKKFVTFGLIGHIWSICQRFNIRQITVVIILKGLRDHMAYDCRVKILLAGVVLNNFTFLSLNNNIGDSHRINILPIFCTLCIFIL